MPRARPDTRFQDLVRAAADVFIESMGYARTQMGDIAIRSGVSKGTLYLYFESKEALFDQAVRNSERENPLPTPTELPVPTPPPGATADYVTQRLTTDLDFAALADQLTSESHVDALTELERVVRQLYRVLNKNRVAIKLIDVCAADHPELAALWYNAGRGGVLTLLQPFLESRIESGCFSAVPDAALASRFILESCMLWGIHIHWDPHPETIDYEHVEDTLVHFIVTGLLPNLGPAEADEKESTT